MTTISREKLRKLKTNKNSSIGDGLALLDCHKLRFHEKNYENPKQIKIRQKVTALRFHEKKVRKREKVQKCIAISQ